MQLSPTLKKTADKYIKQNKDKYIAKGEKLGIAKGEKLGIAKTLLNSIKSLMETMNVTAEKAMKALKIPQEEQEFYLAQLQSNTP